MALDYFYDGQMRRYLLQFTRIFTGFKYETGVGREGTRSLRVVPASLSTNGNRQVGHIQRNNSENTLISTPQISCWLRGLELIPERRQTPNFVQQSNVYERHFDESTNSYTDQPGKKFTVESVMPVFYNMTMQVDLWTSNELQKQQILEQILVLFNPAITLQTSTSPLDWTSLTDVELKSIEYSNKNFPMGGNEEIDMSSMTFEMVIAISAPSKVKRQSLIEQIVLNIREHERNDANTIGPGYDTSSGDLISRQIITPGDHQLEVSRNTLTLLTAKGNVLDDDGKSCSWIELLKQYGAYKDNVSQVRLRPVADIEDTSHDIVGRISINPEHSNQMFWTLDIESLQSNTLKPLTRIINPHKRIPGVNLPEPNLGDRYLIVENDINPLSQAWNGLVAHVDDIIEYTNAGWVVAFNAKSMKTPQYVLDNNTRNQYFWSGTLWRHSIDAVYMPGYWRLFL